LSIAPATGAGAAAGAAAALATGAGAAAAGAYAAAAGAAGAGAFAPPSGTQGTPDKCMSCACFYKYIMCMTYAYVRVIRINLYSRSRLDASFPVQSILFVPASAAFRFARYVPKSSGLSFLTLEVPAAAAGAAAGGAYAAAAGVAGAGAAAAGGAPPSGTQGTPDISMS